MFKNYLKTALRSMLRKKGYSLINVAGLTLGLACCLVIFQYVAFEFSFDRFHQNEPDLYRVMQAFATEDEDLGIGGAFTGYALAPTLDEEVPEIRYVTRMHPEYSGAVVAPAGDAERVFEEHAVLYVDPAFIEMFTFPLVAGSDAMRPGTILLTETAAERYFGTEDPIGRVLTWTGATEKTYLVSGILRDIPANSHLQFDFLLPMEDLLNTEDYRNEPEGGWSWNNFATYVQLHPEADGETVEQKVTDVFLAHRGDELTDLGFRGRLNLQPLSDVHLNADTSGDPLNAVMGSYRSVYFFTVIGLITLLIALFNYVNLATARALDRAREVGVRKVVGAQKRQLMGQFMVESAMTNLVASLLAIGLAVAFTPFVNDLLGTRLTGSLWTHPVFWAAFAATVAVGTVLSGFYPAFVLSSFRPTEVLKGKRGSDRGRLWLRKGLVIAQFGASVVMIGGTVVVYHQLNYMQQMDLGLDIDQVLTVTGPRMLPESTDRAASVGPFVQELRRLAGVRDVATSSSLPGHGFNWNGASFRRSEEDPSSRREGVVTYVDTSFADLYGLKLAAGKSFADITIPDSGNEDAEEAAWAVMANSKAVAALGYASPEDGVGRPIYIGDYEAYILGVYEDFYWSSAHQEQQNMFFGYTPSGLHISVKVSPTGLPSTIDAIESLYERHFPGNVFEYAFLDDSFDQLYHNEQRFATLFTFFAGLAIVIASLGLFGLAALTARQRTREIGVRKVLGASVPRLVGMIAEDFLKLVALALVIGLPLAYLMMKQWLEQFAYRVDIDPVLFVPVALITFLLAFATIAYQSIKAALADPVRSLKME